MLPDLPPAGLVAALASVRAGLVPFRPIELFIPTRFARRLVEVLELALETGQWFVVCAQPGDGKSTALRWFLRRRPRTRDERGVAHVPILAARVTKATKSSPNTLMLALASSLGAVPNFTMSRFRLWFVTACDRAGVQMIVIDDAHELTDEQLDYLRELTDQLLDRRRRVALVLLAAAKSTDPTALPVWRRIRASGLGAWQFDRRTDGSDPLVLIESMTEREQREVLATLQREYRSAFPSLRLTRYSTSMFEWLLDTRIDRAEMKRVRMDSICKVVYAALADAQTAGLTDVGAAGELLHAAAVRLALRGSAFTLITGDQDGGAIDADGVEKAGGTAAPEDA